MSTTATKKTSSTKHRPKATTVFAAAFLAGAAAAVGVNRAFDVHLAQSVPQVESEPIFVAIRSLPKGSPVTIYDVALRDWPKAMLPSTALRADANFEDVVLRHPLQEGQPILSLQLAQVRPEPVAQLAAVPAEPAQPERLVKTPAAQPAPAFVPYEAASPIPLPQPAAAPQAAAPPAAEPTEIAATEPPKAEPTETTEPEPTAPEATELADDNPAMSEPKVTAEPQTQTADLATAGSPAAEPLKTTEPEPPVATPEQTVDIPTVAATQASTSMPTVAAATATGSEEASPEPAPTEAVAVMGPGSAAESAEESAEPAAEKPAARSLAQAEPPQQAEPTPAAAADEPTPTMAATEPPPQATIDADPNPKGAAVAEPTLAVADDQPAPAAASLEPVDVTADVLAAAAAKQAEKPETESAEASPADSAESMAVAQATGEPTSPKPAVSAANATPTPAGQQVMRYLVVPERIAQQVDHSFTRPQPPAEPRQQTGQRSGVRPLPEAAAATSRSGGRPTPGRGRQPTEQLQASAGTIPRTADRPQQQAATNGRQQLADDQQEADQPLLRSLFPNLSAGLTAMGQEWREFRQGSRESTPARSSQQQSTGSRAQRSAARPQQSR